MISKNKSKLIVNVGLITVSNINNPDPHELIIYLFSYDKKKKCFLTENGELHK